MFWFFCLNSLDRKIKRGYLEEELVHNTKESSQGGGDRACKWEEEVMSEKVEVNLC